MQKNAKIWKQHQSLESLSALVKSWALEFGIQFKESKIPSTMGIRSSGVPEFLHFHWQRIRSPVPSIRNPWRGVQNPRLPWIPSHGAKQNWVIILVPWKTQIELSRQYFHHFWWTGAKCRFRPFGKTTEKQKKNDVSLASQLHAHILNKIYYYYNDRGPHVFILYLRYQIIKLQPFLTFCCCHRNI